MTVFQLPDDIVFPPANCAEEDGLLAIGGDLTTKRLLAAYSRGIFPWYSDQEPILWWSPDPRLVLFPDKFKVFDTLRRKIKSSSCEVRFDTNFEDVIRYCAEVERKDEDGTWITPEMKAAYIELHHLGYAHSVETYFNGKLAGGLYGVSLGKAFFGESMFHLFPDASKIALFHLVEKAKEFGFLFIDSQVETSHMIRMGAELIPRTRYLKILDEAMRYSSVKAKWTPVPEGKPKVQASS
jgi:leucyl/phenylalanyl-tRNA---protein transferase